MVSVRRLRRSVRLFAVSSTLASFTVAVGCDRHAPGTATPQGNPSATKRTVVVVDYPDTPQAVFAAARQAGMQGSWEAYLACLTNDSVDRLARSYVQAAATGKPPCDVRVGGDAGERIVVIREILTKQGVDSKVVVAAVDDPAAQRAIVSRFASPIAFVAEVMERMEPHGDDDMLPVEREHWSVQGDQAEVICDVPGGDTRTVAFKKIDGLWKMER